mgnify:CR=1 FL=1
MENGNIQTEKLLKCRKCGATVNLSEKRCPKCGAPILLKVMQEEEKRHLSAKEIRDKEKRLRKKYESTVKSKSKDTDEALSDVTVKSESQKQSKKGN